MWQYRCGNFKACRIPTETHQHHPDEAFLPFHIGLLLFPDITQLDMTGPYEVFIKFPGAKVHLVWKTREPVTAGGGMQIMPTMTFAECPKLDLLFAPCRAGMHTLLPSRPPTP